jgi:hypothetical protein
LECRANDRHLRVTRRSPGPARTRRKAGPIVVCLDPGRQRVVESFGNVIGGRDRGSSVGPGQGPGSLAEAFVPGGSTLVLAGRSPRVGGPKLTVEPPGR